MKERDPSTWVFYVMIDAFGSGSVAFVVFFVFNAAVVS